MSCLVCTAQRATALFEVGTQIDRDEPFQIMRCEECGFQWADPTPTFEALERYYARGAGYRHYVKAGELKRRHFDAKFQELAAWLPAPGRMLDVGCAAGFLIEAARGRGWDAYGVELNAAMAEATAKDTRSFITYGRTSNLTGSAYRLITLFDVLEHTTDPRAELQECVSRLEPGGVIVVQLPCTDSFACRLLGKRWYHYGPPGHLSYFDEPSLRRLVGSLGLEVIGARWTRKLFTLDYFAAQVASEYLHLPRVPAIPLLGAKELFVPMSERLFVLRAR